MNERWCWASMSAAPRRALPSRPFTGSSRPGGKCRRSNSATIWSPAWLEITEKLRASVGLTHRPLVVAGVGVPSVVDREGRITRPWLHRAGPDCRCGLNSPVGSGALSGWRRTTTSPPWPKAMRSGSARERRRCSSSSSASGSAPDDRRRPDRERGGRRVRSPDGVAVLAAARAFAAARRWRVLTADGLLAQYRALRQSPGPQRNELLAAADADDRIAAGSCAGPRTSSTSILRRIAIC